MLPLQKKVKEKNEVRAGSHGGTNLLHYGEGKLGMRDAVVSLALLHVSGPCQVKVNLLQ